MVSRSAREWTVFDIDVSNGEDGWAVISTKPASRRSEDLLASSVSALGQKLIDGTEDDTNYELALCVLGMMQFYSSTAFTEPQSLIEGPRAGIKAAFKGFQIIR
jgi:hypothetical protein